MNKTLEEFNKKSQEYSFNIDSALFPTLSKPQQIYWKHELENAFYNGWICANDLFVDRACDWMSKHLPFEYDGFSDFIKAFKKAMYK